MRLPSKTYQVTGGARIGFVNFTWPLAKLVATNDRLILSTTMFGLFGMGTYSFTKDQVLSIERFGTIPFLGQGVRIKHSVAEYPQNMLFRCRAKSVLAGIASVGFSPAQTSVKLLNQHLPTGFPLRWAPLIVFALIWNLFIGFDLYSQPKRPPLLGALSVVALWFAFGVSLAAIRFPSFQQHLMKPERNFGEVKPAFLLVFAVSGIMATIVSMLFALGGL